MTKTYPLYVTVLCCVLVAALCAGVAFDVGRRIGSNAVRQEAIRAGAAYYDIRTQTLATVDPTRIVNVRQFQWATPRELRRAADHLENRLVKLFPQLESN